MIRVNFLLLAAFLITLSGWSQTCLVREMVQERVNEKGESKEKATYAFSYYEDNTLKEIKIENDYPENNISKDNTNTLKFEKIPLGTKITWFWNGEYDTHFVLTSNSFLEFDGDDENDLDTENADEYLLTYEEGKLIYDEDSGITNTWEGGLVTKSKKVGRKTTWTTTYEYADIPNPFFNFHELGIIDISVSNFIPFFYTLSSKLWISEETTATKEGVEVAYDKEDKYNHTTNKNGCVEQFVVQERIDKVIFTFKY